jgi:hypothetical protein
MKEARCHLCGKVFENKEKLAEHLLEEHPACNLKLL